MLLALYKPEIPPNTGNIIRLSVCTGSSVHIIGKPSFSLDESSVRRAGLDYWNEVDISMYASWDEFCHRHSLRENQFKNVAVLTRFADRPYTDFSYNPDSILLFGQESKGLPGSIVDEIRLARPESLLRIPVSSGCRSINLGNAVSVVLYEGLRQVGFPGLDVSLPVLS